MSLRFLLLPRCARLRLHVHVAGQKAAAYIPGTDANRESKDRQYEEGYRSTPGTGTGSAYGTAPSGYGTGSSQNTSGTAGMTAGETHLLQPCCRASCEIPKFMIVYQAYRQDVHLAMNSVQQGHLAFEGLYILANLPAPKNRGTS